MSYQMTFKRYELKYLLSRPQKEQILLAMKPHMKLDEYGRTIIRNIYFDTDPVFVEIKKKYKSVVYKRRLQLPEKAVMESFQTGESLPVHSQIGDEIQYFRDYYENLHPSVFLSYEREAYYALDGGRFRVTFDENILYRRTDFSLGSQIYGLSLLGEDQTLMEIKTSGGIPLWMSEILTKQHVYKTAFSKYGSALFRDQPKRLERSFLPCVPVWWQEWDIWRMPCYPQSFSAVSCFCIIGWTLAQRSAVCVIKFYILLYRKTWITAACLTKY